MRNRYCTQFFLSLLLVLLLAGCETTPVEPSAPADPQAAHAANMFEQQRYGAAADLYVDLAGRTPGTSHDLYLLLAADSLIHDGQLDKADSLLQQIDTGTLPQEYRFRQTLIQADLALKRFQPEEALRLLAVLPQHSRRDEKERFHSIRAAAYKEMQDSIAYARELIALDRLLSSDDAQLPVQTEILSILTRTPPQILQEKFPSPDSVTRGWLELARLLRDFPNAPEEIIAPYREWRDLYPDHPAVPGLLTSYYSHQQQLAPVEIHQVAVLLPVSGPYAIPAKAIRDGLMSAWYNDTSENRPRVKFYDSSNADQIWPLLNRVADEGADMVIGPLSKQAVLQLARAGSLPLPVLALNQVNTDSVPPQNLYQYSLSPEDEARQVAVWAAYQGYREPAMLYPSARLGERMATTFMETWRKLGGGSLRSQSYDPGTRDFSTPVAQLVRSKQRKAQLEELKKAREENLPYTLPPRGMDFIFAIGNKQQMKQIRPMLQFHYAEDLPVLSTSRAWDGQLKNDERFDMAGIMLPEMPWMLNLEPENPLSRSSLQDYLARGERKYLRLLPMGIDAYQVLPQLRKLAMSDLTLFEGKTGLLYLDDKHQLRRRMTWIILQAEPRILGTTPPENTVSVLPLDLPDEPESLPPAQR
ncbi:penicillin-binding protein activator [Thiolapillus sp.]|uniref:penicillin-binding protein activator n=1 Tax=Thiolapillus sp. TaxID=2017437 RepID=UPI0025D541CA|nr:penicillin-binding protein activator [Thiolapillus sp.]